MSKETNDNGSPIQIESGNVVKEYLMRKKPIIDAVIKKYIPEELTEKDLEFIFGKPRYKYNLEASNEAIAKPIWDFLNRGGKRWRPALFLLVAETLGGDPEKLMDFVVIPEIIHNATLVHDDIEDRSELRRGKPCMHKIFGEDIAINVGDAMLFLPLLPLSKNKDSFSDKIIANAYEICCQEMMNLCFGQAMDIWWHNGKGTADNVTEQEYLQMCAYKTGTLARMSARLAVVLSGGSKEQEDAMGKIAETIGVAFQIQDDILSASGTEFQKKKGYGDDITEGKRTLIVIHALQNASEEDRKRLIEILNMHTTEHELIKEALDLLHKYDSVKYAKEFARKLMKDAWSEAEALLPQTEAKKKLEAFVNYLVEREI